MSRAGILSIAILLGLAGRPALTPAHGQPSAPPPSRSASGEPTLAQLEKERAREEAASRARVAAAMARTFDLTLKDVPLRDAFSLWSQATGVSLILDWESLEEAGVEPAKRVSMTLDRIPAREVLSLLVSQAAQDDVELVTELTPWYVRVETRAQANRRRQRRVYPVADLLHTIPHFGTLRSTISTSFGGRRRRRDLSDERRVELHTTLTSGGSRAERGEALAELVRELVEPELWRGHGGEVASIRYFKGALIVSAPAYVHARLAEWMPPHAAAEAP